MPRGAPVSRPPGRAAAPVSGPQAEQQPVAGDGGGAGQEDDHAVGGSGDGLLERRAVQAGDGAQDLARGDLIAGRDGRRPPAGVSAAQPQEPAQQGGLRGRRAVRCRGGHAQVGQDGVQAAQVRVDGVPLDQAAAARLGGDRGDAGLGGGAAGGPGDGPVRPGLLPDDVAQPVGQGQVPRGRLGRPGLVQRERLQRLDHVPAVRVDVGVGSGDQLGERRVGEPVGQRPGRVAGEAAVQVLAVLGHDERAAPPEGRDVEHRHGADAAPDLPLLQAGRPFPDRGHGHVLAAVHAGDHGQQRAVLGAGQLHDGHVQPGQVESPAGNGSRHQELTFGWRRGPGAGWARKTGSRRRRPPAAGRRRRPGGRPAGGWRAGRATGPGSRWPAGRSGCTAR